MAEDILHMFGHKEITTLLLKQQGIHEGLWNIAIEFGFGAGQLGPSPNEVSPGAIIGINKIGIRKVDAADALTVDAATVNPKP